MIRLTVQRTFLMEIAHKFFGDFVHLHFVQICIVGLNRQAGYTTACNEIVDPINILSNVIVAFTLHFFQRYSKGLDNGIPNSSI